MARGVPIPAPFDDPPELSVGEHIFYDAWLELNSERIEAEGINVNRITRRNIADWLDWHGWADDLVFKNDLLAHINALENFYIPHEMKRKQSERKRADAAAARKQRRNKRRA